ncbi:MAG TPA: hypothetical protein VF334_02480 [Polyangia bacterium]
MKRVLLVAVMATAMSLSLAACSDMFMPPELPDLHKDPYDFAVVVPPYKGDGGAKDMGGELQDLSMPSTD